MTATTTHTDDRLADLGDALERATRAELRAGLAHARRRRRRLVAAAITAVVLIPSAAVAATELLSTDEVARSLPAGTKFLVGTDPTCTTVRANVEYDCTTARTPVGEIAPGQFKGTVEPSVDDSQHVNGGCRALDAAGRHWRCYVGQEAVRQKIIGAGFLGQRSEGPGVG